MCDTCICVHVCMCTHVCSCVWYMRRCARVYGVHGGRREELSDQTALHFQISKRSRSLPLLSCFPVTVSSSPLIPQVSLCLPQAPQVCSQHGNWV